MRELKNVTTNNCQLKEANMKLQKELGDVKLQVNELL